MKRPIILVCALALFAACSQEPNNVPDVYADVTEFVEHHGPSSYSVQLDTNLPLVNLYANKGSVLEINPSQITRTDGLPVQGRIQFEVKEFNNTTDYILSNVQTVNQNNELLAAGPSVSMTAFDVDGAKLRLLSGAIRVHMPLPSNLQHEFDSFDCVTNVAFPGQAEQWAPFGNDTDLVFDSAGVHFNSPINHTGIFASVGNPTGSRSLEVQLSSDQLAVGKSVVMLVSVEDRSLIALTRQGGGTRYATSTNAIPDGFSGVLVGMGIGENGKPMFAQSPYNPGLTSVNLSLTTRENSEAVLSALRKFDF